MADCYGDLHFSFKVPLEIDISKFQFDVEFEGHRFVSHIRLLNVTLAKQSPFMLLYLFPVR